MIPSCPQVGGARPTAVKSAPSPYVLAALAAEGQAAFVHAKVGSQASPQGLRSKYVLTSAPAIAATGYTRGISQLVPFAH